jgi:hypothetical protein
MVWAWYARPLIAFATKTAAGYGRRAALSIQFLCLRALAVGIRDHVSPDLVRSCASFSCPALLSPRTGSGLPSPQSFGLPAMATMVARSIHAARNRGRVDMKLSSQIYSGIVIPERSEGSRFPLLRRARRLDRRQIHHPTRSAPASCRDLTRSGAKIPVIVPIPDRTRTSNAQSESARTRS